MTELIGPTPEEMKPGEVYRVVQHGTKLRLEKVEPNSKSTNGNGKGKGQIVILDLPANIAYVFKIYAAIRDNTLEGEILEHLEHEVDNLKGGDVLGEEIAAAYKEQFETEADSAPSS